MYLDQTHLMMVEGREREEENRVVINGIDMREGITSDGTCRIQVSQWYDYHHCRFVSGGPLLVRKVWCALSRPHI